jgi:hypothetical protein
VTRLADPARFFDTLGRRSNELQSVLPEGAVVAIHVDGPGGGAWQIDETMRLGPVDDAPKDCTIHCTAKDFMAILSGKLGPKEAFLAGRLRIVGDVGLALRLRDLVANPEV